MQFLITFYGLLADSSVHPSSNMHLPHLLQALNASVGSKVQDLYLITTLTVGHTYFLTFNYWILQGELMFPMPNTSENYCAHNFYLLLLRWCLSSSAGLPLEPPCAEGAVGTK